MFVTTVTAGNTGNGVIGVGTVVDPARGCPATTRCGSPPRPTTRRSSTARRRVVATGTYTAHSTFLQRREHQHDGHAGANDSFAIARSRTEDMFTSSTSWPHARIGDDDQAERARFNSDMATVLQQLDQAGDHC